MASFLVQEDTHMSWYFAPTPPPTPTERLSKIISPQQEVKSSKSFDQDSEIQTVTALDILYKNYHTNASSHSSKSSRPNPIQLAIDTDSQTYEHQHDKNTMSSDDDGEEAPNAAHHSPESSLCQTLYPYETETINKQHYTQATGSPFPTHYNNYNTYDPTQEMLEGSPSVSSHSKPVRTASLFTSQFPNIEYLEIINDNSQRQPQPQAEKEKDLLTPPSPPNLQLSSAASPSGNTYGVMSFGKRTPITPETVLEAMGAFPDTDMIGFQSRRKPPPKQLYNHTKAFKQRDAVLSGTNWAY
eukprot:1061383_1